MHKQEKSRNETARYRPISLLLPVSNVTESYRLDEEVENLNLIPDSQSGSEKNTR